MRTSGVITVYLTLIFTIVTALILTTAESARIQSVRMLTETAVDSSMESFLAGYQRELLENYDLFFFDGAFGGSGISRMGIEGRMEEYMDYTLHPNRELGLKFTDFYQVNPQNVSLGKIALATDDRGKVFRSQAIDYMRSSIGLDLIEALTEDYEWAMNNLNESNAFTSKEQETKSSLLSLEEEKGKADQEKSQEAEEAKNQKNPAAEVESIRSMGILELMYSDTSKVSQKSINTAELPSKRQLNHGDGLEQYEEGVTADILFQCYLMKKFAHAASKDKVTEGNLQYQLEYLIIGKDHDVDNLKGVINRLLLIREGANFVYLLTDAGKVAEAYSAAALLVGYTCLPPLIEATKYAILLAWAYAESVMDVRILLAGEKVALYKNAGNWKTSLANIGELVSKDAGSMGDNNGVDYEGYLRMLLLMANQEETTMRAMDLIEIQLQHTTENYNLKMDHMAAMIEATIEMNAEAFFLTLPILNGYSGIGSKRIKITRKYGYNQW